MSLSLSSHIFVKVRHMAHPLVFNFFWCSWVYALVFLWGWGTCLLRCVWFLFLMSLSLYSHIFVRLWHPLCLIFIYNVFSCYFSYGISGMRHMSHSMCLILILDVIVCIFCIVAFLEFRGWGTCHTLSV
jgi:hypothetical protein